MAAQQATLTLLLANGETYTVDIHAPDAASTALRFNTAGPAASTSADNVRVPMDCTIIDFSIAASPTATGFTISNNSGVLNGGVLRYANQLAANPNRQRLNIKLKGGDILTGLQFA